MITLNKYRHSVYTYTYTYILHMQSDRHEKGNLKQLHHCVPASWDYQTIAEWH